ncbi:MAG: hypothetical protein H7246_12280 [Phycisphaerae bacterium]|nr:hypothetical protein [Saprospiraceae bacterium]
MKNLLLTLLAVISTLLANAQSPKPLYTTKDLQTHGLVVWLSDAKARIELFKKHGQHKEALRDSLNTSKQNRDLVRFYRTHFDFCKVNFYYTSHEEDLKNGLPVFLNPSLNPDPSIPLPEKLIIGGFFVKPGQESFPFPKRHFRVENSNIKMDLRTEAFRPFWKKKPTSERDIIRLNALLKKMASKNQ